MTCSDIFDSVMKALGITQKDAADKIGWTKSKMNDKVVRGSLRLTEFIEIMDVCGVDVILKNRSTDEIISVNTPGYGRRVKRMVDRVIYDTGKSSALSNNFFADGVNQYSDHKATELYIDSEGRYFFAEYYEFDEKLDRITPISGFVAAEFITKYGTRINKEPQ